MNWYIQVENGQAVRHPASEENLIQAFGEVPPNWEPIKPKDRPKLGMYELYDSVGAVYIKNGDHWVNEWPIRQMTVEEKTAKQDEEKRAWASRYQAANWSNWIFDEATCRYIPPIPRPAPIEGVIIAWCGNENVWKEVPIEPTGGGEYEFDFFTWQWVLK